VYCSSHLRAPLIALALALVVAPSKSSSADLRWQPVLNAEGVVVTRQDVPGRGFPTFRGVGVVEANVFDVLGVLNDVPRHLEWMSRTRESRLLRKVSETEYFIYGRTDSPWPVADRDAVYRATVAVDAPNKVIDVRFEVAETALMPPVKRVVRLHRARGHYRLTILGPERTLLDYKVDADPEGWVPKWVAKLATRKVPLETIRNLRRQVKRTKGWYEQRIKVWRAIAKAKGLV
jgi:hypothetical protein